MYPYLGGSRGYANPTQAAEDSLHYGLELGNLIGSGIGNLESLFPGSPVNQQADQTMQMAGYQGGGGQAALQRMMKAAMIAKAMGQQPMSPYQQALINSRQAGLQAEQDRFNTSQAGINDRFNQQQAGINSRFAQGQARLSQPRPGTQKPLTPSAVLANFKDYLKTIPGYNDSWKTDLDNTPFGAWKKGPDGYYAEGKMYIGDSKRSAVIPAPIFERFLNQYKQAAGAALPNATPASVQRAVPSPNSIQFGNPNLSETLPSDQASYGTGQRDWEQEEEEAASE